MEHPFGGSWGYQPLSQFAPSARFGEPHEFAHFVDACHRAGIGVILDWVPAHFPTDPTASPASTAPRCMNMPIRVKAFTATGIHTSTISGDAKSPDFLLRVRYTGSKRSHRWVACRRGRFHAVSRLFAAMNDGCRQIWRPGKVESIEFLRRLNSVVAERAPGAITIAEDSTAWPGVSAPVSQGGLGFSYKWNMGWMHDTLDYVHQEPIHRRWHS